MPSSLSTSIHCLLHSPPTKTFPSDNQLKMVCDSMLCPHPSSGQVLCVDGGLLQPTLLPVDSEPQPSMATVTEKCLIPSLEPLVAQDSIDHTWLLLYWRGPQPELGCWLWA